MKRIGFLCVNVNITIDTMFEFDPDTNVDVVAKCERTLRAANQMLTLYVLDGTRSRRS